METYCAGAFICVGLLLGGCGLVLNGSDGPAAKDFGNALSLDGVDDNILIPSLHANLTYTVSAWVNINHTDTDEEYSTLFDYGNLPALGIDASNPSSWIIYDDNNEPDGEALVAPVNHSEQIDQWVHLTFVYGETEFKLYIDGIEIQSTTNTAVTLNTSGGLSIGSLIATGEYVTGLIDDVAIWNVAKTPAEILALKDTMTGTEDGLVAFYNFDSDSVSGTSVQNIVSPGTHDGTLTNGATTILSTLER
ncbi:LamG domain-containing protein [bacterium]|jgi:hypothetical protein|nr:LamG domain-containing protein [bacterium]